jgi:prolipoprotein diacylglyceryltransferase
MLLNSYALLLGVGASLGCWQVVRSVPEGERPRWSTGLLIVLVSALAGSRVWFVLQAFFTARQTLPFFSFWQGGLSWPGAVLGGLAGGTILVRAWRMPAGLLADRMLPLMVLLPAAAWLGCWQAGCAYGRRLPPESIWGLLLRDETGLLSARFPLQFLAVLLLLGFAIGLMIWQGRLGFLPGQLSAAYGMGLGLDLLLVAGLRADAQPAWQSWPVDGWAALGLVLGCGLAWFIAGRSAQPVW